jgi:hypothetical protein
MTTKDNLIEYKNYIFSLPSTTDKEKSQLKHAIKKCICCQWYVFHMLHTRKVVEMTAQEWKEVTNQGQFIKFATSTYGYVKEKNLVCLLKDLFIQNRIPLSLSIGFNDDNKTDTCPILMYLVGTLLAKDEEYLNYKFLLIRLGVVTSIDDFLNLPDQKFVITENFESPSNETWGENWLEKFIIEENNLMKHLESLK